MSNRRKIRNAATAMNRTAQEQDQRYFEEHPDADEYVRPATAVELRETGYPPGTRVVVWFIGGHTRGRAFIIPDERNN